MEINEISYRVLGIAFTMPAAVIEERIMKMGEEEFIAYARGFIDNPYHPCSCYVDREAFKTREEWEKYEIEADDHRLIRQAGEVKLYWERGGRLNCLIGYGVPTLRLTP